MGKLSLVRLLKQVHSDEEGAVSLETILIIGAIALPILIFLIVEVWPWVRDTVLNKGLNDLSAGASAAASGPGPGGS